MGERKVRTRRASSATWAVVQYMRTREPPKLRIAGAEWSAAKTRARRSEKERGKGSRWRKDRLVLHAATVWTDGCGCGTELTGGGKDRDG